MLVHRVPQAGFGSDIVTEASVQVITALVLVIVGFVVEQWCRIPPEDTDGNGGNHQNPPGASGVQPTARRADTDSWSPPRQYKRRECRPEPSDTTGTEGL